MRRKFDTDVAVTFNASFLPMAKVTGEEVADKNLRSTVL